MIAVNRFGKSRGFTLVELVVVIVLLGIVASFSTQFINQGVGVYVDTVRRDKLQQVGRYAVERISREVRNALPGSVRLASTGSGISSVQCLEFFPIVAASSYLNNVTGVVPARDNFQAVDFDFSEAITNHQVAIHTIESNDVYQASSAAMADLKSVGATAANQRTITLTGNLNFTNESVQNRFFIVNDRVSFCASNGELRRYQGYTSSGSSQAVPPAGGGVLLAEFIQIQDDADNDGTPEPITVFNYQAGALTRSGVLNVNLRFRDNSEPDEWVRFSQEVFLRNTP